MVRLTFAGNPESGELIHAMPAGEVDGPVRSRTTASTDLLAKGLVVAGQTRRLGRVTTPWNFWAAERALMLPCSASWLQSRPETAALWLKLTIDIRFEVDLSRVMKD